MSNTHVRRKDNIMVCRNGKELGDTLRKLIALVKPSHIEVTDEHLLEVRISGLPGGGGATLSEGEHLIFEGNVIPQSHLAHTFTEESLTDEEFSRWLSLARLMVVGKRGYDKWTLKRLTGTGEMSITFGDVLVQNELGEEFDALPEKEFWKMYAPMPEAERHDQPDGEPIRVGSLIPILVEPRVPEVPRDLDDVWRYLDQGGRVDFFGGILSEPDEVSGRAVLLPNGRRAIGIHPKEVRATVGEMLNLEEWQCQKWSLGHWVVKIGGRVEELSPERMAQKYRVVGEQPIPGVVIL